MADQLVLPKFLTKEMATRVIPRVIGMIKDDLYLPVKRRPCPVCRSTSIMLHTVVLVPAMKADTLWPKYPIESHALYEYSEHKSCNRGPEPSENLGHGRTVGIRPLGKFAIELIEKQHRPPVVGDVARLQPLFQLTKLRLDPLFRRFGGDVRGVTRSA